METCNVAGCENTGRLTRGMCRKHHTRVLRYGSIEGKTETTHGRPRCKPGMTLAERIAHIGYTVTPSGCWEWRGHRHDHGYAMINWKRKPVYVHRMVLAAKLKRPLLDGMFACHSCDNPPCINPAHLFEGTTQDNHRDMTAKGRGFVPKPVGRPPKYPKETFVQVKSLMTQGASPKEVANATGISLSYAYALTGGHRPLPYGL